MDAEAWAIDCYDSLCNSGNTMFEHTACVRILNSTMGRLVSNEKGFVLVIEQEQMKW
jgi:hypothetical protein